MAKPYPWYYAVNDRPVKIVQFADGSADCLVFDFATGDFIPDRSYFSQVIPGSGKDVDQLTEAQFERLVAMHREAASKRRRDLARSEGGQEASATKPNPSWPDVAIIWERTSEGEFHYRARIEGTTLTIRVNDFPAEPLYTLLADGKVVEDLEDWPLTWVRPA